MSDSLQHYGVLGMKWGVRRTPEQLGHRKEAKLEKYKAKETGKLEKRRAKQVAKVEKAQAKASNDPKRNTAKLNEARKQLNQIQTARYKAELKAIQNMTYKDMQKEKLAVGKQAAKSALISIGSTTVATLTPIPVAVVSWPNVSNIKSNVRLGAEKDKKK